MKPFIGAGTAQWPEGTLVPHLYLLPNRSNTANADFFDLAARHRQILADRFSHLLTPVQERWLHATVQMVSDPHTPHLSKDVLSELIDRLGSQISPLTPFAMEAAPHVGKSGPGLDLAPDGDFDRLVEVTGAVLDAVLGQTRASYRTNAPHITTGYCHTAADSGPVASALRASRPSRARLIVDSVALVMVTQDAGQHAYKWEPPLAVIGLQGSA